MVNEVEGDLVDPPSFSSLYLWEIQASPFFLPPFLSCGLCWEIVLACDPFCEVTVKTRCSSTLSSWLSLGLCLCLGWLYLFPFSFPSWGRLPKLQVLRRVVLCPEPYHFLLTWLERKEPRDDLKQVGLWWQGLRQAQAFLETLSQLRVLEEVVVVMVEDVLVLETQEKVALSRWQQHPDWPWEYVNSLGCVRARPWAQSQALEVWPHSKSWNCGCQSSRLLVGATAEESGRWRNCNPSDAPTTSAEAEIYWKNTDGLMLIHELRTDI